jgi:hypothetical protein
LRKWLIDPGKRTQKNPVRRKSQILSCEFQNSVLKADKLAGLKQNSPLKQINGYAG